MVTRKLLTCVYGTAGIFQSLGGFLTYFVIMRDFGFPIQELIGLSTKKAIRPNDADVFDQDAPFWGNTNEEFIKYCHDCWAGTGTCEPKEYGDDVAEVPDWLYNTDKTIDLRLWYMQCTRDGGIEHMIDFGTCYVKQVSYISKVPVCYTVDALKFAQTGFFFSIALAQISNAFACKTRKHSFIFGGLNNFPLLFGFCTEVAICLILSQAEPIQVALNTRDVTFLHFGVPSLPFSVLALCYDEARKFLIRNMKSGDPRKPNWFARNHAW